MAEIKWTDQSLNDIENIAEFIAKDSEYYASVQVNRFFEETEILHQLPYSGRIVPEINNKDVREIISGNYRIIYKIVSSNRIDILTVHNSNRMIKDIRLR